MSKFVFLLVLIANISYAKVVCMGGVNVEAPLESSGMDDLINVANNTNPFSPDDLNSVCEAICMNSMEDYKNEVISMMSFFSGSEKEKYSAFHQQYFKHAVCGAKTIATSVGNCSHENANFLKNSILDFQDSFIDELIKNQNVDLNALDPSDGKSAVVWVKEKCDKSNGAAKNYYCSKYTMIKCRAYVQQPVGAKPSGCGAI